MKMQSCARLCKKIGAIIFPESMAVNDVIFKFILKSRMLYFKTVATSFSLPENMGQILLPLWAKTKETMSPVGPSYDVPGLLSLRRRGDNFVCDPFHI